MDPSYVSSEDEEDAMAKAMGFSSFGNQGPTKKRKFNPKTDAIVDGQELAALDKGGKKGQGSGGNTIPLGKPRVFGIPKLSHLDEIDLVEDHLSGANDGPAYVDTSLTPPLDGLGDDEGPAYIDTSLPPPDEEVRAAQERIDAILAENPSAPKTTTPDMSPRKNAQSSQPSRGIGHLITALHEAPGSPASSVSASVTTGRISRERGQRNVDWYLGYYDPSFNENPWASLEKAKNLKSRGTWLQRQRQNG